MLRNILIGVATVIVVLVAGSYLTPRMVHVERTVVINVAPEDVFGYVNDFARFNDWSPWVSTDPEATYVLTENTVGVGAGMSWSGEDVGVGAQEITLSEPYSRIETHLDFGPDGDAVAFFTFVPTDDGTEVTWGFDTDMGMNPIGRYMGLMMDKLVGTDYERGLNNLKAVVEG